ncbi:hypothetical protein Nizo1839_1435 [Lactiplantibacillus plantarum]|nr:hypothetical protein FD10_GL000778 [Lactiplantibacillus argentoratensis DSM 16365]KZT81109.1 hypothetical protein Nizo1839_1435 [Lactiplantibacillus plantarum]
MANSSRCILTATTFFDEYVYAEHTSLGNSQSNIASNTTLQPRVVTYAAGVVLKRVTSLVS